MYEKTKKPSSIGDILTSKRVKRTTRKVYKHQVRGYEIAEKLGSKSYPKYFKIYKESPYFCELALSWVSDYPNSKNKEKLFFWKVWQLRKEQKNKQK